MVATQANDQMANQLRLNGDANEKLGKLAKGINNIQVCILSCTDHSQITASL